jgi:ketosteroid isomerase-like protein
MIDHNRREMLTTFGTVLALTPALSSPLARAATVPAGDTNRLAALGRDVDRAESVRQVKRMQVAWAQYVDLGEWDMAAALFTDDAELAHADDHFRGRTDIRAYFQRMIGRGTIGLPDKMVHTPFLFAPIITLSEDGQSGHGRWHAYSMRGTFGGDASWQSGIFNCQYARENGVWKIRRQIYSPMALGPYETGWRPFKPELPIVPYEFAPDEVGKPFPLGPDIAATSDTRVSLPALAGRIQALRDETAIRNLQNAYGYYVDWKMWDDVVDLFAPGGSVAIAGIGTYRGPRGVRRSLERSGPAALRRGEVNDHIQGDLVIEVSGDGRTARARGIQLGMIGKDNKQAWWTLTRFDNLFVRQGGVWRFDRMRKAMWLMTDYDKGWAKDWQSQPEPPPEFAPDDKAAVALPAIWQLERTPPAARPLGGMSIAQAEATLHAAAGVDSIENLAGAYGQYLDDNQWDELASLFAAQGERDSAGGGFIRTPARIAAFSRQRYGAYNPERTGINMHMRNQPVIHVSDDGFTGQSRTRLFQIAVVPMNADGTSASPRGGPMFTTGMYEDDIIFEEGVWKIKRADIDHLIYAPYKTGWKEIPDGFGERISPPMASVANTRFDAYNTGDIHSVFPKVPHMWFHYRNPVSGRVPQYLMPKYMLPQP